MTLELDHRTLSEMGAKWCKKPASQNGHGCNIAIVEGCANRENADVIGFRHSNPAQGSVVIEVKVSRSDFLNDKRKLLDIVFFHEFGHYLLMNNAKEANEFIEKYKLKLEDAALLNESFADTFSIAMMHYKYPDLPSPDQTL